jgi:hypothetical protein
MIHDQPPLIGFGLQLQRVIEVRFESRGLNRRGDLRAFSDLLAGDRKHPPLGMVKSGGCGQLFFCDCGH